MKTYYARLQSGEILTRKTNRTYSHVTVSTFKDRSKREISWVGRPDLLPAAMKKWQGTYMFNDVQAVPVSETKPE